jgi:PhzF family phenazine biosynthesis protein
MRVPIFQVDAFALRRFSGNPAAVMLVSEFPADSVLQAVAAENNLSETAFLRGTAGEYQLRWFTPTVEVPLCGHATLASAAVVMERLETDRATVIFHTKSGAITVNRIPNAYVMDFPARPSELVTIPDKFAAALGVVPVEVYANQFNYMALLQNAQQVRKLAPDMTEIISLATNGGTGVIVTAAGDDGYDFVSRYFSPAKGIPEDPVTGAAHCMLAPYWATRLGKTAFRAYQASSRGGEVICRLKGERVELEGNCVFYLEGEAEI